MVRFRDDLLKKKFVFLSRISYKAAYVTFLIESLHLLVSNMAAHHWYVAWHTASKELCFIGIRCIWKKEDAAAARNATQARSFGSESVTPVAMVRFCFLSSLLRHLQLSSDHIMDHWRAEHRSATKQS